MLAARKFPILPSPRPDRFVELVRQTGETALHVIKTYDRKEKPCWFLLKTDMRSVTLLEATLYEDMLDLTQFGEVIACGWSHEPDLQF